jgi:adenylate cyclase
MKQPVERRLAAILAADVAGYSRLMGADEEGTHERVTACLTGIVDPKIAQYRGRIVKSTGDGFLAEFASVVDAVRSAVEVQREMAAQNIGIAADQRIAFRIGINLGDIIVERHDIFGDGVNVAARLEALAEPGGICVSRVVRDQVRDKLDFCFEDLGEQRVKNIVRPVRVYRVRDGVELPASTAPPAKAVHQPVAAPRLSIVVLPFANLDTDPEQQYFADGITEDLTTDLSRLANMFVISRNTAFTYRNKPVDTKQIGRDLGVRYLLEGSVRRLGNRIRVNAQLIDVETDVHLWAERFDRDADDLLTLQDEVTSRIAMALNLELIGREAARPADNPDAIDYILRGRASYWKPPSREQRTETIGLFERALALDPGSVEAQSSLANELASRVLDGWADTAAADIARAEELVASALATSPRNALAHYAKGTVLRVHGRPEEAIPEYETIIALGDRSWVYVYSLNFLARCKILTGSLADAIPLAEQAIRLSPRDPYIFIPFSLIGHVHLLQSRTEEAILWFEKARSAHPSLPGPRALLASAYALKGQHERAVAELAEARRLSGDDRYSSLAHLKAIGYAGSHNYWGVPKVQALFEATYFAGLRKAGVPEE